MDEQTDSEFLYDLAERIMHIPVRFNVDQADADRLRDLAASIPSVRITYPQEPLPPVVDGGKL